MFFVFVFWEMMMFGRTEQSCGDWKTRHKPLKPSQLTEKEQQYPQNAGKYVTWRWLAKFLNAEVRDSVTEFWLGHFGGWTGSFCTGCAAPGGRVCSFHGDSPHTTENQIPEMVLEPQWRKGMCLKVRKRANCPGWTAGHFHSGSEFHDFFFFIKLKIFVFELKDLLFGEEGVLL